MRESFGARMRQQREDRGIALRTIAEQTKIKLSLLEGLERDDLSNWPAGIFQRAYVRAYAHAIGLDPDVVVREFLETHQQPVEVVETPQRTPRFRGLVGSAMGSLSRLRRDPVVETRSPVAEPPPRRPPGGRDALAGGPPAGPADCTRSRPVAPRRAARDRRPCPRDNRHGAA